MAHCATLSCFAKKVLKHEKYKNWFQPNELSQKMNTRKSEKQKLNILKNRKILKISFTLSNRSTKWIFQLKQTNCLDMLSVDYSQRRPIAGPIFEFENC